MGIADGAESRGQRAEGRGQRAEGRGQRAGTVWDEVGQVVVFKGV